jgi:hypothetical protein
MGILGFEPLSFFLRSSCLPIPSIDQCHQRLSAVRFSLLVTAIPRDYGDVGDFLCAAKHTVLNRPQTRASVSILTALFSASCILESVLHFLLA